VRDDQARGFYLRRAVRERVRENKYTYIDLTEKVCSTCSISDISLSKRNNLLFTAYLAQEMNQMCTISWLH